MELYEAASVVAIYKIDINKSVHINMLCKTFYINVIIFNFCLLEFLKSVSNFTHHTLRIKRHSSHHPSRNANKQAKRTTIPN